MSDAGTPGAGPVRLLAAMRSGSIRVDLGGEPLASVEAGARLVTLRLEPILARRSMLTLPGARHPGTLWRHRDLPRELAHAGWKVTFTHGEREVMWAGRDTSALTGHIHVGWAGLKELWRLA